MEETYLNTVNKANRTLSFIRHNLGDCTTPVKAAAYSTVMRAVLDYSTISTPNKLQDVSPTCPESLQRRRYIDSLSMLFRVQHDLVDVTTYYIQPNNTRMKGSQRLRQLYAIKDVYKYSFYPRTICDWNQLPTTVTDFQTLQEFREGISSLPSQLLRQY